MLKFTALDRNNKTGYFVGLSRANLERLTTNQPIKINLADMGGPDAIIVIMFGENDRLLFNELQKSGMISREIQYREAQLGTAEVIRIKRENHRDPDPDVFGL